MNCARVYMLASDHRWQWEEWCDRERISRARIGEVKSIVVRAFMTARVESEQVARFGALLLDRVYGADAVAEAQAAGIPVGTPVEKAGVFPLTWQESPFYRGLTGNSFAKVLVRYRPEWEEQGKREQMDKLLEMQAWCREQGMTLLIEIVIMRRDEDEDDFEERGRPALLAELIRSAYERDLVPDVWKIEGTSSADGAAAIDAAIRERDRPRQLILGKGADPALIGRWFDVAAPLPSTAGFAIGRSVFWEPGTAYLKGQIDFSAAAAAMSATYLSLVDAWSSRAP